MNSLALFREFEDQISTDINLNLNFSNNYRSLLFVYNQKLHISQGLRHCTGPGSVRS